MATYHSLNVAMGMSVAGLEAGAIQARQIIRGLARDIDGTTAGGRLGQSRAQLEGVINATKMSTAEANKLGDQWKRMGSDQTLWRHFEGGPSGGGSMVDSAIKAVATYHALRVGIFSVASGAEILKHHLEASGQAGGTLFKVATAIESSFHKASGSMHALVETVAKNVYNFATGDMSDPMFRDATADKQAEVMAAQVRVQQDAWAKVQARRRAQREQEQQFARNYEQDAIKRQERLRTQAERNAPWVQLRQQLDTRQMGENERRIRHEAELRGRLVNEDLAREAGHVDRMLAKREAIAKVNEEGLRLNEQLDALEASRQAELELRAMGHGGGGGFALGSREEYAARLKAEQGSERTEDKRHQQKLERLLERVATLQAELVRLGRPETVVIPGAT